jgi:hypothetical protein
MARIHMPGLDMTLEAAADLSTHQFKFVIGAAAVAGGQQARVNVSGANGRSIGILQNKPNAAGLGAVVRTSGRSKLVVDASAIVVGSPLKSDGTGQGTLASADKDKIGAIAMEANGSAAVIIDTLIMTYDLAV